jgi:hypothetical protein
VPHLKGHIALLWPNKKYLYLPFAEKLEGLSLAVIFSLVQYGGISTIHLKSEAPERHRQALA